MPAPVSLRRRLAPAAATVMALAVGIAVGAGPLSDVGVGRDQLAGRAGAAGLTDATAREALAAADELAAAAAPGLYDGALADRSVALVTMPGAQDEVVDGLRRQVSTAGARVTGTYAVGRELTSPGSKALVDSLGRRILDQQESLPVDPGAPTYERAGALLGLVVASTRPEGQEPVPAIETVGESLGAAGLLDGPDDPRTRAPLVLVVLGAETPEDPATDAITRGLLDGLAARTVGTVVAGSTGSAVDGVLRRLRETSTESGTDAAYATVDGVDRVMGRVVAGLAVVRAAEGARGDWGVLGADGAVPRDAR